VSHSTANVEHDADVGRYTFTHPSSGFRVWVIALVAGFAAGFGAWGLSEPLHELFRPQLFEVRVALTTFIQPTAPSTNRADLKNAILVFTVLGGVSGLVMGVAGGLAVRSLARGLTVGLVGLVAGAAVGALASWALLPLFYRRVVPDPNDLLLPMSLHAGVWMAIGATVSAAFALGMGLRKGAVKAAIGGCVGALIATLIYHGLGEVFYPDSASTLLVATSTWVRLLAALLITVLSACGAARGSIGPTSSEASAAS
jgi:hypothetical protein